MLALRLDIGKEVRDSFHTGKPVLMAHMASMEAWDAAGLSGLVILFGLVFMAAGFGWIKSKDHH